jgi:hypothetical protein
MTGHQRAGSQEVRQRHDACQQADQRHVGGDVHGECHWEGHLLPFAVLDVDERPTVSRASRSAPPQQAAVGEASLLSPRRVRIPRFTVLVASSATGANVPPPDAPIFTRPQERCRVGVGRMATKTPLSGRNEAPRAWWWR